jgi:hypothetical protein
MTVSDDEATPVVVHDQHDNTVFVVRQYHTSFDGREVHNPAFLALAESE